MPPTDKIFKRYFTKFSNAGKLLEAEYPHLCLNPGGGDDAGQDESCYYARWGEAPAQQRGEHSGTDLGTTTVEGGPSTLEGE